MRVDRIKVFKLLWLQQTNIFYGICFVVVAGYFIPDCVAESIELEREAPGRGSRNNRGIVLNVGKAWHGSLEGRKRAAEMPALFDAGDEHITRLEFINSMPEVDRQ